MKCGSKANLNTKSYSEFSELIKDRKLLSSGCKMLLEI